MSSTRTDVRLANGAWEALMTAHASLLSEFEAEGMWQEASMKEYDVLYTLAKRHEAMRLCDIRESVLLSQPALSRLVDRLVARGLVTREADAADGRAVLVSLTEEGARVQSSIGRAHARSVTRELGSALDPAEMRQLERLCNKLAAR